MKQGERIKPAIREFIIETMRNASGLSYEQIADRVQSKYNVKVDKTSVGRILRKYKQTANTEALSSSAQQASQPASEPQKDHLAEIRDTLLEWQRELVLEIGLGHGRSSPSTVEGTALFRGVLEHCPSLKDTYSELGRRRRLYEERKAELEAEMRQLAPPHASEHFSATALLCAVSESQGNPLPAYTEPNEELIQVAPPYMDEVAFGNAEIRKQVEEQYINVVQRYSEDRRAREMPDMEKAILEQQHQLASALEYSILSHEHRTTGQKCEFCRVRQ